MENGEKKPNEFIRETVTNKSAARRRVKRVIVFLAAAVLFGLIACLVFVAARPYFESLFPNRQGEEETEENVSLSLDETPEETETAEEETETEEEETPPEESEAPQETEEIPAYEDAKDLISQINRIIVSVGTQDDEDLEVGGLVFSSTSTTVYILADCTQFLGVTDFAVTLKNGTVADGVLRASDSATGLCVIGVQLSVLEKAGIIEGDIIEIGRSSSLWAGDVVYTVGAPYGKVFSGAQGQVVYRQTGVTAEDRSDEIIYTDLSIKGGSFLINGDGEFVGVSTQTLQQTDSGSFYGISSVIDIIEHLANGQEIAYLGVRVSAWSEEQDDEEVLSGAYVENVTFNSPAYEAGIQAGDIIIAVGEETIYDASTLSKALLDLTAGDEVDITVYQQAREGYAERHYTAQTTAR